MFDNSTRDYWRLRDFASHHDYKYGIGNFAGDKHWHSSLPHSYRCAQHSYKPVAFTLLEGSISIANPKKINYLRFWNPLDFSIQFLIEGFKLIKIFDIAESLIQIAFRALYLG